MRRTLIICVTILGVLCLTACGGSSHTEGSGRSYVALGDSYTAAPLVPKTDLQSTCLRSNHNYPHLLADELGDVTLTDVSCSGATTRAITDSWKGLAPQIDAVKKDTDIVTVGIGANDFGISRILFFACRKLRPQDPHGAPCHAKWSKWVNMVLPKLQENVENVLHAIRDRAPDARVIAVGYPQVLPRSGSCAQMEVAKRDSAFIRTMINEVDDAILAAARDAHVDALDIRRVSAGHDICSDHPWINGVLNAPGKAAALHPFESEQRAVARLLARKLAAKDTDAG